MGFQKIKIFKKFSKFRFLFSIFRFSRNFHFFAIFRDTLGYANLQLCSQLPNITSVVEIIREGRTALMTTIGMFKVSKRHRPIFSKNFQKFGNFDQIYHLKIPAFLDTS